MPSINKISNIYFLVLFSLIPISIFIGATFSLINILLIIFSFILFYLKKNLQFISSNRTLLFLIILYIYLIINSFFSVNFEIGVARNFGFVRFIMLFIAINFFFKELNFENIFKFWLAIFLIFLLDILFEFFIGHNIFGFASENRKRLVSFFKDEQVIGTFLNGFGFILIGFVFSNFEKITNLKKCFVFFFLLLLVTCMIFSGERSNTIKLFLGLIIFFYLNDKIKFNYKIFFLFFVILIFSISFFKIGEVRHRYGKDLIQQIVNKEKREKILYFQLYNTAYEMFKKNVFTGVGNKNYRIVTCKKDIKYVCSTHPHQIYFEFLSEHGLIGSLILLSILFYLIFKNYRKMLIKRNLLQIGCFSYLLINFIPILPGGSFFSDFNATFFWINFSIFYASNTDTNIFKIYNDKI